MASKKTVSKTSKKAKAEFIWGVGEKVEKRNHKKANKEIKKLGFGTFMLVVLLCKPYHLYNLDFTII